MHTVDLYRRLWLLCHLAQGRGVQHASCTGLHKQLGGRDPPEPRAQLCMGPGCAVREQGLDASPVPGLQQGAARPIALHHGVCAGGDGEVGAPRSRAGGAAPVGYGERDEPHEDQDAGGPRGQGPHGEVLARGGLRVPAQQRGDLEGLDPRRHQLLRRPGPRGGGGRAQVRLVPQGHGQQAAQEDPRLAGVRALPEGLVPAPGHAERLPALRGGDVRRQERERGLHDVRAGEVHGRDGDVGVQDVPPHADHEG
mmetsp:Transcript_86805/g.254031  ORF Transcript_86805/g.254031 Transcript_86805/m.254031 type:complete len:253 (+) Transcript_86805:410-1168(+)